MRCLTDTPEAHAAFPPPAPPWRPLDPDSLTSSERTLWHRLAGTRPLWVRECLPTLHRRHPERLLVLIDEAPTSQFGAITELLRSAWALPGGLICHALRGHGFRGQRERTWVALPGNLHLTAHYTLDLPASRIGPGLTVIPAVAAVAAIRRLSQGRLEPRLKWVNDLLLNGCKVAGVLTTTHLEGETITRVVFGAGINLERAPDLPPTPFVPRTGSLVAGDPELSGSLPRLLGLLIEELDAGVDELVAHGPQELLTRYRESADFLGRQVCIWPEQGTAAPTDSAPVRGRVVELLPDLSLRLEGVAEPVSRGRLVYEETCHRPGT